MRWLDVLELANLALITPRLSPTLDRVNAPEDVIRFVSDVAGRNEQRNLRLYRQLADAAAALNASGITPVVLKGGAVLARSRGRAFRMISDIDLVVAPSEVDRSVLTLASAGFFIIERYDSARLHAVATLGRVDDPGQIDLHQRPPGPAGFGNGVDLLSSSPSVDVLGAEVRVPEPHVHVYLQAMHDQLQDGGFWRGGIDLRHAWDLRDLIDSAEGVDWGKLDSLPPTRLAAKAVELELLACHQLTHAKVPERVRNLAARIRSLRHRVQFSYPLLRAPLGVLAVISEMSDLRRHRQKAHSSGPEGLPSHRPNLWGSARQLHIYLSRSAAGRV